MVAEPRRIHVSSETELRDVLAQASESPVLVEAEGKVYRISPEPEGLWSGYDPAAVRHVLQKYVDLMTPEEGKQRIVEIYRAREEGSRPPSRP